MTKANKTNSGHHNSGGQNSGNCNSGNCNSGDYNSGDYNSGDYNSGDYNSGNCNSGDYNSGNCNSGHYNSGNYNSGNCNAGNCNSGDYNSGDYNSGFFNSTTPTVRLFNRDSGKRLDELDLPNIALRLVEWVSPADMTNDEKSANPTYQITGGFLRQISYKAAWGRAWAAACQSEKEKVFALPGFDAAVFEEITGIKTTVTTNHGVMLDEIRQTLAKYGYDIVKKDGLMA